MTAKFLINTFNWVYALEFSLRLQYSAMAQNNVLCTATTTARRFFGSGSSFEAVLLADSPFKNPDALKVPQKAWLAQQ